MITITLHGDADGRLRGNVPVSELPALIDQPAHTLWVDCEAPTPAEIRQLGTLFAIHPLALEDAERFRQRPKLDIYDNFLSIVFFALSWPATGGPRPQEIHLLVGANFLVTVHPDPMAEITETATRWSQRTGVKGKHRIGLLVYALLDAIVDGYFPIIDTLADKIEALEDAIFDPRSQNVQAEIFALKKDLLAIRRVVAPERDVMNVLIRRDTPLFGQREIVYFQDVYDHVLRVTDAIDLYRDLLSSALDASMSLTANRLNHIMRTLTASSIILMSMALIAGIYGMNFEGMPELQWAWGYPFAIGLMLALGAMLLIVFRRMEWF